MEGTPSQAASEDKPSLPHGSQKEAGVCVCDCIYQTGTQLSTSVCVIAQLNLPQLREGLRILFYR